MENCKHPCTVSIQCVYFLRSYCIEARLKVQEDHTKVNIELDQNVDMENLAPCNVTT